MHLAQWSFGSDDGMYQMVLTETENYLEQNNDARIANDFNQIDYGAL